MTEVKGIQEQRIGGTKPKDSAAKTSDQKSKDAAKDFEALLVKQMLDSMWATIPTSDGVFQVSREEEQYRDMLNDGIARNIASGKGLGIKDVLYRDISKLAKK